MATTKDAKVYVKTSSGGLNRPQRMVKMVQARCRICNEGGHGKRGWWEKCPHDPYFRLEALPRDPLADLEEQEDGTFVEKADKGPDKYIRVPNMKQIPLEEKSASGKMVQIQLERGSKFPEDLGYAPICEFRNCWEPNPKWHTRRGNYHTRDEAAIIDLRETETPIYIGLDKDIERRREQLDRVNVREVGA